MSADSKMVERVTAKDAALELISEIHKDHSDIFLHQSGDCCDDSSPMRSSIKGKNLFANICF